MPAPPGTVLELRDVQAGYGRAALVLRGLSVTVHTGEVVCLVGPNGAGKSTVLKVASGLLVPRSGSVLLGGRDVTGASPQDLLGKGMAHVLQGHSVFREMTVEENVRLGGYTVRDKAWLKRRIEEVKEIFPVVGERWTSIAGLLSGGQQKQVEFARALMLEPKVILLDEPSMGLDPKTTSTVFEQIDLMRQTGVAVLLVEQNARRALEMADIGCVLDLGRVHISGPARELVEDPRLGALYLGGSAARKAQAPDGPPDRAGTAPAAAEGAAGRSGGAGSGAGGTGEASAGASGAAVRPEGTPVEADSTPA
ncbi:ABC transporter ATP-binding protein [Streptosporangium sp. NPDC002544]|uniref:ABC transporter ATP-binding protein n=1 Tax=Streptosporangium sp. NPDC002544 TaxID=3154538 RepID=UPI00332EF2E1